MNDYVVKPVSNGISIDGKRLGSSIRIVAQESGSFIRINGRRYRDNILVNTSGGKCTVINELGLEDYLNGILPSEVNAAWSPETLKAQAVISRTYVLRNLRKHEKDGFDVCTETHCQVYGGVEAEDPRTNSAVAASRSEVLVYKGELAQSLFHASCGGHTENPNCVWTWDSAAPEYLKGVKDKFCAESPHNYWKNTVTAETIKSRLARSGYNVGTIKKIKTSGRDNSGRPEKLKITSSEGTLVINPSKFRMAIDPWIIKSAFITSISRQGKAFVFEGKGWGHGVGLCQWGAKVMGDKGYDYKQILELYYPGTDVEKWEE
jgi:stage II sporulation protein D